MANKQKTQEDYVKKKKKKEFIKCGKDPEYFMRNYVHIQHQKLGNIKFDLYDYQKRTLKAIENYQYNVVLKARQMGLSTLAAAYSLWLMTFYNGKDIGIVSMKRDTAKELLGMVKFAHANLPVWLKEKRVEDNKLSLGLENDSRIFTESTQSNAGRSGSYSMMIIDEAAFIDNAQELWSSAKPTLDTADGKALVLSTPKNVGSWFHQTWSNSISGAEKVSDDPELWSGTGENDFHPIKVHWSLHPNRDSEWRKEQDRVVGPTKAAREFDCNFETSGDSVVDPKIVKWYSQNQVFEPLDRQTIRGSEDLWIWEEPKPNTQYVLSADVSRGDGDDFSAFHILSTKEIDQKAEYKGKIPPEVFANLIYTQASYYNDALVVIERNTYGFAVLQELIRRGYKNILYTSNDLKLVDVKQGVSGRNKKKMKPGLDTNSKTRPLIISKMNEYVRNGHCFIHSSRLVEELRTFVWNNKGKPEHMEGYNDDLVLSFAFGCWVRDTAIKLEEQLSEITKKTLTGFSTNKNKALYTSSDSGKNPWVMNNNGKNIRLDWLL